MRETNFVMWIQWGRRPGGRDFRVVLIEGGVGIGIVPESAALRHRQTMQLSLVELSDDWVVRERLVLAREFDALPGCARALVDELMKTGSGGAQRVMALREKALPRKGER